MTPTHQKKDKAPALAEKEQATGGKTMAPPGLNLAAGPVQAKMPGNQPVQMATPNLTDDERHIYAMRHNILAAASASNVDASLVAAILLDEHKRYGFEDSIQDTEAWFIQKYEGLAERAEVAMWEGMFGPLDETSFGAAQMNLGVAEELVEQGYVDEPANWDTDRLDAKLALATDDSRAPFLVAGRIRQTIDHWNNGGVDISARPEILGTLYSMGLTGRSGVNSNPQPNARGTQIQGYMSRMNQVITMP